MVQPRDKNPLLGGRARSNEPINFHMYGNCCHMRTVSSVRRSRDPKDQCFPELQCSMEAQQVSERLLEDTLL